MIRPARLDLAGGRWVPFFADLEMIGLDLTGATFGLQVRQLPDAPGSPLVDLGTSLSFGTPGVYMHYTGADTVANHIAAARLSGVPAGYDAGSVVHISLIRIHLSEAMMESFPFPAERGDDAVFHWDLHGTIGGLKRKYIGGTFTVEAGVTQ